MPPSILSSIGETIEKIGETFEKTLSDVESLDDLVDRSGSLLRRWRRVVGYGIMSTNSASEEWVPFFGISASIVKRVRGLPTEQEEHPVLWALYQLPPYVAALTAAVYAGQAFLR